MLIEFLKLHCLYVGIRFFKVVLFFCMKIYYYILGILLFAITFQSKSRIIQVS